MCHVGNGAWRLACFNRYESVTLYGKISSDLFQGVENTLKSCCTRLC